MIEKIVSGGQPAQTAWGWIGAIRHDIPHGGWCPKFRKAEDGVIPAQHLLTEIAKSDHVQRTEWNVRGSDGTPIFSLGDKLIRARPRPHSSPSGPASNAFTSTLA